MILAAKSKRILFRKVRGNDDFCLPSSDIMYSVAFSGVFAMEESPVMERRNGMSHAEGILTWLELLHDRLSLTIEQLLHLK